MSDFYIKKEQRTSGKKNAPKMEKIVFSHFPSFRIYTHYTSSAHWDEAVSPGALWPCLETLLAVRPGGLLESLLSEARVLLIAILQPHLHGSSAKIKKP